MSKARVAGFVLLLGMLGGGCAARTSVVPEDGGGDGRRTGDAVAPDSGDVVTEVAYRDVPLVFDTYREDACPEGGGSVTRYECDPLQPTASCPTPGDACYPYIEYPMGTCGTEVYGARCIPAGTLSMNDFCATDTGEYCGSGLTCFVTGSGNRCLRLCSLTGGTMVCPHGQVCEPTDSPNIGACD